MATVSEILKHKHESKLCCISSDDMVINAVQLMSDQDVGALAVMEGGHLVGVISERDYCRKVVLELRSSSHLLVKDIMESPAIYVTPQDRLDDCMLLMTEKRVRHLPVLDNGLFVGMISIGDMVKELIGDQRMNANKIARYTPVPAENTVANA